MAFSDCIIYFSNVGKNFLLTYNKSEWVCFDSFNIRLSSIVASEISIVDMSIMYYE